MKKQFTKNLLLLVLIFLALQLNFKGYAQGKTIAVNQTITYVSATPYGGVSVNINGYKIHTFNSGGTLAVPKGYTATGVEVLIVAGGGGGGYRHAGGGGAGGLIDNTSYTLTTTQSVVVGSGGAGALNMDFPNHGVNGDQSSFDGSVTIGGGGGGSNSSPGQDGGSGGGGSNGSFGGAGTAQQGQKGGDQNNGQGCCHAWGNGGGGYLVAGANTNGNNGSNGGAGAALTISGSSVNYADGGGGGNGSTSIFTGGNGSGGSGGNANSLTGLDAIVNTGSGGGGGGATSNTSGAGGSGSSGIVIIKYIATSTGTWSSDNNAIATVDANGLITGKSAGSTNINYAENNGMSSSKYSQQINVTAPLPVTMLYFIASQKECTTQLSWKTNGEINSSYYGVENSTDGIVFVQAAKIVSINSATGNTYTHTFTSIKNEVTYYRLKIVDADGKFTYSKTVALITNGSCGNDIQLKISPNPAKNLILVEGVEKGSRLTLLNTAGKQLSTLIASGISEKINISAYPNGVYILKSLDAEGNTQTLKVVKQ